ncbi:hypothetical protein [Corynebacterium deserti]|uniref:hypothetical protein n=1 Tax=Corynebacterium deserti TaxID=1408191 RepID=UPI0009E9DC6E|nr:hypothetical protein [Corynebacterium deserti]
MQYRSIVYGEALAESDVVASVGSKGDSYDNAMAEALNSVFKAELIDRRVWPSLTDVLVESSRWIGRSQHLPAALFLGLPTAPRRTSRLDETSGSSGLKLK